MFKELTKNSNKEFYMPFPPAWIKILVSLLYGSTEIGMSCGEARGVCTIAAYFGPPELLDLAVVFVGLMLKMHQAKGQIVPPECFERDNIIEMSIRDVRDGFQCCSDQPQGR